MKLSWEQIKTIKPKLQTKLAEIFKIDGTYLCLWPEGEINIKILSEVNCQDINHLSWLFSTNDITIRGIKDTINLTIKNAVFPQELL
jgi:hypothetical protein